MDQIVIQMARQISEKRMADSDGIPDSVEGNTTGGPDSDSDGTPDFRETDADSDGIPDSVEGNTAGGPDSDSDGTPRLPRNRCR